MAKASIYYAELKMNLPEIIDPYPRKEPCSAPINLPV